MNPGLELVRAGAGSGKTTDLCRIVAEAVDAGLDPSRLLATTFTKKAATELKARMQARLLARPGDPRRRAREAERLELAAIGTVHSVAHQILSRYALDMGLSPRLEVMDEAAEARILGSLLGSLPRAHWEPLETLANRLGIPEDALNRLLLSLLSAKRANRIGDDAFIAQLAGSADRVCALLADGTPLRNDPEGTLAERIREALDALDALSQDTTQATEDARLKLRRLASESLPLWGAHAEAARLKAGKRSGADACLDALRNHAASVCLQTRLHTDIRDFTRRLGETAQALDTAYTHHKRERGLLDFTDLEILLLQLLEDPDLGQNLAGDFDLALVDEFQDTNPLQLAIFQRLRHWIPRSRWVGDPKQAIYGFRGTDPQLVDDLWNRAPHATREHLPRNHRSQKGLVQLVGALFEPVLGPDARQQPVRAAEPRGVERWCLETRNKNNDAKALACGVAQLGDEGVRWGDIAILVRTNRALTPLAHALESLGIPCLLETPGLLSTREGALAVAGLRLVADRYDSLAAATVMHLSEPATQPTPTWILDRLQSLREPRTPESPQPPPWQHDPRLARLETIPGAQLSPTQVLQEVIEALELPARIAHWPDPARRCAHLDSLLRHGREYEETSRANGSAPTLVGCIRHLERLAAEQRDLCHPPLGHNAVTLMTYHGAKGLEWPVVVLTDLNDARTPDLWWPRVSGGGADIDNPLQGRSLRAWVWPFGKSDGEFPKPRKGTGLEDRALASPEGSERITQEATEALRLLYVGCTRAQRKLVFAARADEAAWLETLPDAPSLLNPARGDGEHALPDIETTLLIRTLDESGIETRRPATGPSHAWFQPATPPESRDATPPAARFHSPSAAPSTPDAAPGELHELPGTGFFPTGAREDQYQAVGHAMHALLAAAPSLRRLDSTAREQIAERCLAAHAVTGILPPAAMVAATDRFLDWVDQRYPGATWHTEVPVTAPRSQGGRWQGFIDLLLHLPDGAVVLVDHKSAPIRRDMCPAKAREYTGQLAAYREQLAAHGEQIRDTWIHFPLAAALVRM
jgi:ATP-dependent exoDNAse (exonuclease V) beta subunit